MTEKPWWRGGFTVAVVNETIQRFVSFSADLDRRSQEGEFGKWPWQEDYGLWPWQRRRKSG